MRQSVENGPFAGPGRVRRRRVIYIPGYDPVPARKYREMYRAEGAEQARLSGYALRLRPVGAPARGAATGTFGWEVEAEIEGAQTQARVEVLVWSDIVKRSMAGGLLTTYGHLVRTAWVYLSTGALWRLARLRKGPVIAALYPVAVLLGQLGVALVAAWLAGRALALLHPLAAWGGLALVPLLLWWFRRLDGRLYAHYLMHDYAFSARFRGADPPELSARIDAFADHVAAALADDADEVLVVGHSSGAHIAVSVLARLIRARRLPADGPALSLLTLGQVIPMVSFLPEAGPLRADLALVSRSAGLTWVDVTAPGDGCAFALCDPVSVSGAAGPGRRWPLVLSAAFTRTLSPARWKALRWRFFRLHFQYLCAFDALKGRRDDYDYFRITAGPLTLARRLGARAPSPSRIERPLAGYGSADAAAPAPQSA